jgi:hypothetical protein
LRLDHSVPDGVIRQPDHQAEIRDLVGKPERFPFFGERSLWGNCGHLTCRQALLAGKPVTARTLQVLLWG